MINSKVILYSEGKNDECYTPEYAVKPLLKYVNRDMIIWCPFDDEKSAFVKIFSKEGYNVKYTHIKYGQNFLEYEPEFDWDIIISNPPFTNKKAFFEKAIKWGKPFALLMSNTWLNDSTPKKLFGNDLELLMFWERIKFLDTTGKEINKGITFSSSYFCKGVLPRAIICESLFDKKV